MAALMGGQNVKNIALNMLSFFSENYNKGKRREILPKDWQETVTMK